MEKLTLISLVEGGLRVPIQLSASRGRSGGWSEAEYGGEVEIEHLAQPPGALGMMILRQVQGLLSSQTPPLPYATFTMLLSLALCNPSPACGKKVDVMVLYSEEAWSAYGSTVRQLLTTIAAAFATSDLAMVNSDIDLEFNIVRMGPVSAGVEQARPHGAGSRTVEFLRDRSGVPVLGVCSMCFGCLCRWDILRQSVPKGALLQ